MTRQEYKSKRDDLMAQTKTLIDNGKITEANVKMDEVKALDTQWQSEAESRERLADMRALSDNQPIFNITGSTGEIISTDGIYRPYLQGVTRPAQATDPTFLSNTRTMTDIAKENQGVSPSLLQANALGDTIRGIVTGRWNDTELKNAVTTSGTSVLIPEVLSANIIDLARAKSLFASSGVPTTPMSSNNLTISRLTDDGQFAFKEEGEEGIETGISVDGIRLDAHTIFGYCYVSLEAIQSSNNLTSVIQNAFANAVSQAIDMGMLYGQQDDDGNTVSYAPSGIMNDEDILTLEATNSGYDDFILAQAAIKQLNYYPSVWAINAYTDQSLQLLKDGENRYLGAPASLSEMTKIVSNQLSYDSENGSDGLVFDPQSMLIGIQDGIRIKMIEDEKSVKNGLVAFRVTSMLDCKVVTPNAICRITGLK